MTVYELYQLLNEKIPPSLSCPWDNDGLMCCPDKTREVRRVLIALDVTEAVVNYAAENQYDLIVSHHPLIFKGLKTINGENPIAAKVIDLIRHGISVISFHTRLDAVSGGVNDRLASLLGLEKAEPFGEDAIGRIGTLSVRTEPKAFAAKVKSVLQAPFVLLSDAGVPVYRVAVLGGSGKDDIQAARAAGADTYVSGELSHHSMTDAPEQGMNLIEAGHFYTENPICEDLRNMLLSIDSSLSYHLYNSHPVKMI